MHCHIVGPKVNAARLITPEQTRRGAPGDVPSGTVFRSDGAPIPVRACLASPAPATHDLLTRIDHAIAALHESSGGA